MSFLRIFFLFLCCHCYNFLSAQQPWHEVAENVLPDRGERRIVPDQYRLVRMDIANLQTILSQAPLQSKQTLGYKQGIVLELPMPKGGQQRFQLVETPVMASALQARYARIRSYTGRGIEDPTARIKCDVTPHGFHAMICSARNGTSFIDPYQTADSEHYVVYAKSDYRRRPDQAVFSCGVEAAPVGANEPPKNTPQGQKTQIDGFMRKYRLALACTGEYAAFHGGTKELVLAAMVTSMHRVNGVYENEFAVTMELVPNTDTLIFFNTFTDPYTNNDGGTMLGENQETANEYIGADNYDIGHVFSTGGGGVAGLGVVCSGNKAFGVTGQSSPIGDAFDIDYVAHEMGHQFAGNHTQGNDCNRSNRTAVEPGSGSTIMAYAGICPPDVQMHSDAYFHGINVEEVVNFIVSGDGDSCPEKIPNNNTAPTVSAGPDVVIPKGTPFFLTAQANDMDGDSLTYCWEQMDNESAVMPPSVVSVRGPMFRSFDPTPDPVRVFPKMSSLILQGAPTWEKLPSNVRTMKFRVTARDNNPAGGATATDDMLVTVDNSGPFRVTSPNTNQFWFVGDLRMVTWDVASTDQAPINCKKVNIRLSADGGLTYPILIAENVDNNGRYCMTVPDTVLNRARIRIEAVGGNFFDISNVNFPIRRPTRPVFSLCAGAMPSLVCTPTVFETSIATGGGGGFDTLITFSAQGLPAGATATFTPNPAPANTDVKVRFDFPEGIANGVFSTTITAQSGNDAIVTNAKITTKPGKLAETPLRLPTDGAILQGQSPLLVWTKDAKATGYDLQVARDLSFENTVLKFVKENTTLDSQRTSLLEKGKIYFWRVRPKNECGASDWSHPYVFGTPLDTCRIFTSNDLPRVISAGAPNTVESKITINTGAPVSDVNIQKIRFNHTFFRSLEWRLVAPNGAEALVFGNQCGGTGGTYQFGVDSDAPNNLPCPPPTNNLVIFKPTENFSKFRGLNSAGDWILRVRDNAQSDGGNFNEFSLEICTPLTVKPPFLVNNNLLIYPTGNIEAPIGQNLLMADDPDTEPRKLTFQVLTLPENGTLAFDGAAITPLTRFTQADINDGKLKYLSQNGLEDQFRFLVYDERNNFLVDTFHMQQLTSTNQPNNEANDFTLVPNPASKAATLRFSQALQTESFVRLCNAQGQVLQGYSISAAGQLQVLSLEGLPAGLYWVSVENKHGRTTKKLVVF